MRSFAPTFSLGLFMLPLLVDAQTAVERQKKYLKDNLAMNIAQHFRPNTRRVSVKDSTWADWLARAGELPPDFYTMKSTPNLPEPLFLTKNGKEVPITTLVQWNEKRNWIKAEFQQWISGHVPPAPKSIKATIISDWREEGTHIQMIRLNFGPDQKAIMTLELMVPTGKGPKPVFMVPWTHRDWAQLAVRRGYIACVYAAADTKDDTEAYMALYPDYDFSMLMRRAWGASRVVDYLYTRPEVNKKQLAIAGHSRNGKQALWAAAFDERITAVISSSSGTGGDSPWRYGDPQYASETLDLVTAYNAHWFHPRLRFFFGHEDRLPVDQNLLGALIAPRALLYHYSIVERGINPWANEQNFQSVKKVYRFLRVPEKVGVLTRMGEHAVAARDVEKSIDFLDIQFKRINKTWHNQLYFQYRQLDWEKAHPADRATAKEMKPLVLKNDYADIAAFEKDRQLIIKKLKWLLGDEPPGVKAGKPAEADPSRYDWIDQTIGRPEVKNAKAVYLGPYTPIGDHVAGILYSPLNSSDKARPPVVIYLHQYAYSTGYARGYSKTSGNGNSVLFQELVKNGFAVLAIDLFGFGTRIEEATNFYERFPNWSKLGKMVNDVKGCVDALKQIDSIDPEHIFILGNSIGGSVGLMAAALDDRIAGVATVAAVSPWRTSNRNYETIHTYTQLHSFVPRLGLFSSDPKKVPIDFAEIMAASVPRPLMMVAPDLDWHTDLPALQHSLSPVKVLYQRYGAANCFKTDYPHELNRISPEMTKSIIDFYREQLNIK
ncbi:MAG: alpha/beta fold hydrolase [Pedobacter sp.]|nr:alpha/beta fold hydrolase [Pedobacter sp.]MDQ8052245.1 alpha/beta fold hydrolase [Pedobacter sp.]